MANIDLEKLTLLYEGKAKQVYATDNKDEYIVHYKDDATAFNGEKPLKHPILEFCYKNDELGDPFANESQITALGWATQEQLDVISTITLKVNDILKKFLATKNVTLVDFKVEFGTHNGEVLLGDEISPDTCRFWDATTGEKLDKDRFRRDLGNIEEAYKEMLFRLTGERA
ncbi:MAG: phosphoribosylaminoimidazolesuccinocarboxamide synthase [Veillonella sp.]|nr:phosphoribosylaminoimidazolesuccinocarboxamide synthase [Veillonella sp.]